MKTRIEYTLKDKITEWSSTKRRLVGLSAGAILGCYVPLVPLTLVGIWIDNWLNWTNNIPYMGMLLVMAFFVERVRKPFLVYSIVVGVIVGLIITMMVLTVPVGNWVHYWVLPYYLAASVIVVHKTYRYIMS